MRLHNWYRPAPAGGRTILFCHGNAGNIANRRGLLDIFEELGFGTFLLGYRGFGRSTGHISEAGLYADARAAFDWLTADGVPATTIVLYGESLGTAVATELALRVEAGALVLQAPFTNLQDMAAMLNPEFPKRGLPVQRFDSLAKIRWVGEPLLILHSSRDEIVPFEQGRRLFEAAREPKTFAELSSAGHNTMWRREGDVMRRAVSDFLR